MNFRDVIRPIRAERAHNRSGVRKAIPWGAIRAAVVPALIVLALLAVVMLSRWAGADGEAVVIDRPFVVSVEPVRMSPSAGEPARTSGGGRAGRIFPSFYDFGNLHAGEVVRRDFYLTNEGDEPLEIREAYTTCGCTTAEISAAVIPPRRSARVTVIFDSGFHSAQGQTVRRGVILETSDPARPQVEIWVQASIK